jgi:hypothetical protein
MIKKLALAAVFSFALVAGIGLVSYNSSLTTSPTIAEVTSAETVNLGFSPATQSVKPGETKTITLEATYSPTITLTAIDLALNYDPSVLTLKKLESPTLTTTLVPPRLDTSPATFTFGLNPQDLVNANADQQVCPQHVDPNNSGRCVNLIGTCGGYTNGCMMSNICRKPFRSCTNNTPDPLRTLLLTYEVKSNATPNTTTTLTIADSTQLAITSRDDNALGTKAAHTINIVPPITTGPGDFNVDGRVNLLDFNLLLSRFGTEYTIFHFTTLIANFGKTY